jgi:cyclophilin family peptidyl-prolyl cis-trans isomerase
VVLGCRVALDADGRLRDGALARRVEGGARLYAERGGAATVVVASGGRRWAGAVEADVIARELVARGIPECAIVRERCSMSTRDNARFSSAVLARRGLSAAAVVTCRSHLMRALACFANAGVEVEPVGVGDSDSATPGRIWAGLRERVLRLILMAVAALVCAACSKKTPAASASPVDGSADAATDPVLAIARAEDMRRAGALPRNAHRDRDPRVRRAAARALARILDPDDGPLLVALGDDDDEVVSWAGYGLGQSCKGREDAHVRALSARLASVDHGSRAVPVLLRALGRCSGDTAEQTLRAWLRRGDDTAEAAAYALGDVGAARGSLSLESTAVLLDAAQATPPLPAALYAFGRSDSGGGELFEARLVAAARASLARPGEERVFAIRAFGRLRDPDTVSDLAHLLVSSDFSPAERAEAARALGRLRSAGQAALAEVLPALAPSPPEGLTGDGFGVLLAAVESLGDEASRKAETTLWSLARLEPGPGASPALVRRTSGVRCAAAARLARGAWDSDVLRGCDVGDGQAGALARIAALDRGPLLGMSRRAAWVGLARSEQPRVREAALGLIGRHPELGEAAHAVLADALADSAPGIVAVAAEVVQEHPDRVFRLAESERRAALDPRAPPPTANPARELDASVAKALRAALAHPWPPDRVETRVALVDAALAVGLEEGRALAQVACKDENATVRARAAKALATLGATGPANRGPPECPPPDGPADPAAEIGHTLAVPARVVFDTDAGILAVRLEPALAPVAATRLAALARSGFYTGIAIHRVAPGFVVQLGDRGGDGYGGAGELLRCETSPVPFGPLEVGLALAGRDTGSSQVFITLARYPHLDGEYPWVGRAEGDWNAVAEGDVVRAVRVED